ncbi:abscisic stress-ripening protein 2-like isoform X1 [Carex rostrata]
MAEEEQKHNHLFHQKKEEEGPVDYEKKEKHHKHVEQISGLTTLAPGAYALIKCVDQYEKQQAKKDPENAHSHRTKEEIAAVAAVGGAGFAFHEHHKKKDAKNHQ